MIDIDYIAKLSKLDCNDAKKYAAQIKDMITLADGINLTETAFSDSLNTQYCSLRDDIPDSFNSKLLINSGKSDFKNYFTVPKII